MGRRRRIECHRRRGAVKGGVRRDEDRGAAGAAAPRRSVYFVTVSDTVVVRTRAPLVPVMVKVNVPFGVLFFVATVSVEDPEPVTEGGLKLAVAPPGSPLAEKVTVPAKPPEGVTVTV